MRNKADHTCIAVTRGITAPGGVLRIPMCLTLDPELFALSDKRPSAIRSCTTTAEDASVADAANAEAEFSIYIIFNQSVVIKIDVTVNNI